MRTIPDVCPIVGFDSFEDTQDREFCLSRRKKRRIRHCKWTDNQKIKRIDRKKKQKQKVWKKQVKEYIDLTGLIYRSRFLLINSSCSATYII